MLQGFTVNSLPSLAHVFVSSELVGRAAEVAPEVSMAERCRTFSTRGQ